MKNLYKTGLLIGVYAYGIFFIGTSGLLSWDIIFLFTVFFLLITLFLLRNLRVREHISISSITKKRFFIVLSVLLLGHQMVNLTGALAPEIAFDALWYHLTLPKMYIAMHHVGYIPGGLFYYSSLPQLGEMLFIPALIFGNEIAAKIIHFIFSLLIGLALYKISRTKFSLSISLLVVICFYTNLVVAWEATTAYVDLIRTFFEFLAFSSFLTYIIAKSKKYILLFAVFLGFACATKLIALSSLIIYSLLMLFLVSKRCISKKDFFVNHIIIGVVLFFILLPWNVLLSQNSSKMSLEVILRHFEPFISWSLLNPIHFLTDVLTLFLKADDPVSPIYIIIFPLAVLFYKKLSLELKVISLYCMLSIFVWYITPRTGGGRFILPYLPVFSLLVGVVLVKTKKNLKKTIICIIIFLSVVTILYRTSASIKYLQFYLGNESKSTFLSKNLNFSFGDFYDTDGYFARNINQKNRVLLFGFHNLYYVDFPFIHESYIRKGDTFNYIAIQNADLPKRFSHWQKIYENKTTYVSLYKNQEKDTWIY